MLGLVDKDAHILKNLLNEKLVRYVTIAKYRQRATPSESLFVYLLSISLFSFLISATLNLNHLTSSFVDHAGFCKIVTSLIGFDCCYCLVSIEACRGICEESLCEEEVLEFTSI